MEADLRSQSVAHLKKMVSTWTNSHRIKGYSRMRKDELVQAMMREMMEEKKEQSTELRDVISRMKKTTKEMEKRRADAAKADLEARKKRAKEAVDKKIEEEKAKAKAKAKTEVVTLGGEKVEFKEGALRRQLKMRKNEKLTKPLIQKMLQVPKGGVIKPFDKPIRQTNTIRKRLQLALTLMK